VLRLGRFQRPALALTHTGARLADDLLGLGAGDVLLLMTYAQINPEVEVVLERAAGAGTPVVLLTDTLGPAYAERVSATLSARRDHTGHWSSTVTTLAVLDALLFGLAARDRRRTLETLETLRELRARIDAAARRRTA
jgi:DNA-binding MurR/RpiR family transcriptional regulator